MQWLLNKNVIAFSGRAVEAAGDIDVLLLDKTGKEAAFAAFISSQADDTPEGRSIIKLAIDFYGVPTDSVNISEGTSIPFSAETRMSGFDISGDRYRKSAADSVIAFPESL